MRAGRLNAPRRRLGRVAIRRRLSRSISRSQCSATKTTSASPGPGSRSAWRTVSITSSASYGLRGEVRPQSAKPGCQAALPPRKPRKRGRKGQLSRTKDRDQTLRAPIRLETAGSSRCPINVVRLHQRSALGRGSHQHGWLGPVDHLLQQSASALGLGRANPSRGLSADRAIRLWGACPHNLMIKQAA